MNNLQGTCFPFGKIHISIVKYHFKTYTRVYYSEGNSTIFVCRRILSLFYEINFLNSQHHSSWKWTVIGKEKFDSEKLYEELWKKYLCFPFFVSSVSHKMREMHQITKTEKETKIIEVQNYEFRIDIVVTNITKIISSKRSPSVDI